MHLPLQSRLEAFCGSKRPIFLVRSVENRCSLELSTKNSFITLGPCISWHILSKFQHTSRLFPLTRETCSFKQTQETVCYYIYCLENLSSANCFAVIGSYLSDPSRQVTTQSWSGSRKKTTDCLTSFFFCSSTGIKILCIVP